MEAEAGKSRSPSSQACVRKWPAVQKKTQPSGKYVEVQLHLGIDSQMDWMFKSSSSKASKLPEIRGASKSQPSEKWHRWSHQRVDRSEMLDIHSTSSRRKATPILKIEPQARPLSTAPIQNPLMDTITAYYKEGCDKQYRMLEQLRGLRWIERIEPSSHQSMRMRIRAASIRQALTMGDPHGDFSWDIAHPAITELPTDLINSKQLDAFECLMTDLRFLRRLLQMAGAERTLLMYIDAQAVFAAENRACHRLESYAIFVSKHVVLQKLEHQLLFRMALACKVTVVRSDAIALVDALARKIRALGDTIVSDVVAAPIHFNRAASVAMLRVSSSQGDIAEGTIYEETTRHLRLAAQIAQLHEIGLAQCLPLDAAALLPRLKSHALTKLEGCRSKFAMAGIQAQVRRMRLELGLTPDGVVQGLSIEQARSFLDVTQVQTRDRVAAGPRASAFASGVVDVAGARREAAGVCAPSQCFDLWKSFDTHLARAEAGAG